MSIRGEFLRFPLIAAVFFGVVLGIPYVYRLMTSAWAAPSLHPKTAVTGKWSGILLPAPLAPKNLTRDPYFSEYSYQESLREQDRAAADHAKLARAVYLDLSVDPFTLGIPKLRGVVRMCAYNGAKADFQFTSMSVGDDHGDLMLTTKVSDEVGELAFKLTGGKLQTTYGIMGDALRGDLVRGDLQDFQSACDRVKASSATESRGK